MIILISFNKIKLKKIMYKLLLLILENEKAQKKEKPLRHVDADFSFFYKFKYQNLVTSIGSIPSAAQCS